MTGMDGRQNRFDCSSSMRDFNQSYPSPQEIESQKWDVALEISQRALNQSLDSAACREFRSNNASVWKVEDQDFRGSFNGTMRGGGSMSAAQSPISDTMVKLGKSCKGRHDGYAKTPVASSAGIIAGRQFAQELRKTRSETPFSLRSHTLAGTSTQSPHQPYFGDSDHTRAKPAMHSTSSVCLYGQTERLQGPLRFDASPSVPTFQAGYPPSTLSSTTGPPKDLHMPQKTELHEIRRSDRVSGLPSTSSTLSSGLMRQQRHETDRGGVPLLSVPERSIQRACKMGWRRPEENSTNIKQPEQSKQGLSSSTIQRSASTGPVSSAFDITPRSAQIDDEGNISIHVSGHSRKHTDPFVDPEPEQYGRQFTRPSTTRPCTHFQVPSQPSMRLSPIPISATWPTPAPQASEIPHRPTPATTTPASATLDRATPLTPSFLTSPSGLVLRGRPPTRFNVPSLHPPLSSVQGKYHYTPEARARLEAQKPTRREWICTEAAKIAQLARLRQAALLQYMKTQTKEDYESLQKTKVAYADATNTEKRKEQRRNLVLNENGMTALKTDKVADMSADSRGKEAGGEEEKLLGYQMAMMERVCAEIKRDKDDAIITAEMLAILSLDEKKALRKHLLGRLGRS